MVIGIVGLGLIGGSLAKAYKEAGHTVYAYNRTRATTDVAIAAGVVDEELNEQTIGQCEYIHLSLYPDASIAWLRENAELIHKSTIVLDECGTKRKICQACWEIAHAYGFTFVGGHPMAGTHFSGFRYSRASMFNNASMILVPEDQQNFMLIEKITASLAPLGLKRIVTTDPENHDRMIAYTSQLAHVVSSAYIKSPSAQEHKGYSAGSFRDLTRVAWLNEKMWTELFLENGDFLASEIDLVVENLQKYSEAIKAGDAERLEVLLREGRIAKEQSEKE
jgi:prephenate dehydrogenase